jgi:hypothetical protein
VVFIPKDYGLQPRVATKELVAGGTLANHDDRRLALRRYYAALDGASAPSLPPFVYFAYFVVTIRATGKT